MIGNIKWDKQLYEIHNFLGGLVDLDNLYYQITPIDYEGEQIFSFAPLYLVTDLLFRKYAEYVMQGSGE